MQSQAACSDCRDWTPWGFLHSSLRTAALNSYCRAPHSSLHLTRITVIDPQESLRSSGSGAQSELQLLVLSCSLRVPSTLTHLEQTFGFLPKPQTSFFSAPHLILLRQKWLLNQTHRWQWNRCPVSTALQRALFPSACLLRRTSPSGGHKNHFW
jgi:hypothetical protein